MLEKAGADAVGDDIVSFNCVTIPLSSKACILHLLNSEEIAVGDVGGIKEFVDNAQSVL